MSNWQTWKAKHHKFYAALLPSSLIGLNIFIFGPFTIYQRNQDDFILPFTDILRFFLGPAIFLVALLCLIGVMLNKRRRQRYIAVLLMFGMLLWIQGNLLVWHYGFLDGRNFDVGTDDLRGWIDGGLWIILALVAIFCYQRLATNASLVSGIFIGLQLVLMFATSLQYPELWKAQSWEDIFPPGELYKFSSKQNVIHIILDAFQSDIFQEIIEQKPDHYYSRLDGFTFFKDTTGSYPTTFLSIPAIFSGDTYQNDIPIPTFTSAIFQGNTILNSLYDNGFDVDLAVVPMTAKMLKQSKHTIFYEIPVPYSSTKQAYIKANSVFMLSLVLFRYAPHHLKKILYQRDSWLIQRLLLDQEDQEAQTMYFAHKTALQDLIHKASVQRTSPVYKFFHFGQPHAPFVVTEQGEYAGKILPVSRQNATIQSKYTLDHLLKFLDTLKALHIYDSSLIVIQADHGGHIPLKMRDSQHKEEGGQRGHSGNLDEFFVPLIAREALPLLMIKPPYSRGNLNISMAQAMLTDIPATINAILHLGGEFPGESVFNIAQTEDRSRKFYHHTFKQQDWQNDFFDRIDEYIISGSALDVTSWQLGDSYHKPGITYHEVDFGTEKALSAMRTGWGGNQHTNNGDTVNWALGNTASLFLSLPKHETVDLAIELTSLPFASPQQVTVRVDGKYVGQWTVPAYRFDEYHIMIPPDAQRPDVSVVEFGFSQHLTSKQGNDQRPLAALFKSLRLNAHPSPYQTDYVDFGTEQAARFKRSGWSYNEIHATEGTTSCWALGSSASLVLTLPKQDAVMLTAIVGTFLPSQSILVKVDGHEVGSWDVSPTMQWETHRLEIPRVENRPDVSIIEFVFSQSSPKNENENRELAVFFDSISLHYPQ